MKKDTRSDILRLSRELFDRGGYTGVPMRAVSDALGISVGNLTYHFKRKEDLVEAVLADRLADYRKPAPASDLADLNDFFMRILGRQGEGSYYFKYIEQLPELCPAAYEAQRGVLRDLREALEETFKNLRAAGLIKRDAFPDQTPCVIDLMMGLCVNGAVPGGTDPLKCFWSLIYPMLK